MPKFIRLPDGTTQMIPDTAPLSEGESPQISPSVAENMAVAPTEEPEQGSKWNWIGSPDRPEAQEHSDGISDLLEVNEGDFDETEGVDDLVDVDFERDILDANENGDIEDLVNVSMEDIMGSAPRPRQRRIVQRRTIRPRYQPPTSMGRSGG